VKLFVIFCAGLLTLPLMGCRKAPDSGASQENPARESKVAAGEIVLSGDTQRQEHVVIAPVTTGEMLGQAVAQGTIALPDNDLWKVGVLAAGRVEHVYANLGDTVSKGQVLARFHSHEVHEVRASFGNAAAELSRRQADEALAQREYDRSRGLYVLKAVSVADTESAKQALTNAHSATRVAQNNLRAERAHLEDLLDVSGSALDSDSEESELVPIKSPAGGMVLQKNISPGQTVSPSTDTFIIGNLNHLWMMASVGAAVRAQLHLGQNATVSIPDVPSATYAGIVKNLGMEFDPTTRLAQVRIDITHPDARLRPQMLAKAQFSIQGTPSILIPQDALQQVNGQDVVFVAVAPDRFRVQAVETSELVENKVRITRGLSALDRVIAQGSFIAKSQLLKSSIGD
jgi:cobalt-zinc-cadmium efflux system membrane fusion protein